MPASELDLWWLLAIPFFFALGWLAARVDIRHVIRDSRSLPKSYFRGLNFLLNEQPDQAIDAFLEATRVDPETIELHFALGNLFRRRGETDRAIRMHRNLVEREGLGEEQRLQALEELGHDYLKAGLLDRAEDIFTDLSKIGQKGSPAKGGSARGSDSKGSSQKETALQFLLEIYQQEKEWQQAIAVAQQLPEASEPLWQKDVANFHCELAEQQMGNADPQAARASLEAALATHRRSVRATMLLGDLEAAAGDPQAALAIWKRIEQQDPRYLALVSERLKAAHRRLGRSPEGLQLMRRYLKQYPSFDLLEALFQWVLEDEDAQAAHQLVRDELRRNPSLLGLDKLLEAQLLVANPEQRTELELMRNLIHAHTRKVARYGCGQCGFKARQFYWRCPGCGHWESYPPIRSEELDSPS